MNKALAELFFKGRSAKIDARLVGDRKSTYSWRVTGNLRITFRFRGGDAIDVDLEDYH